MAGINLKVVSKMKTQIVQIEFRVAAILTQVFIIVYLIFFCRHCIFLVFFRTQLDLFEGIS